MDITKEYEECMHKLIKKLEEEFMQIIANPKLDKKEKNLRTKPLVTKKQILLNTLESLKLVERSSNGE
ncbi:hypothetical protein [Nitratiruptor sp. YY09-18]|uniref:hypothetical protein n=1 Tax=Nitratiruptor sp. YY09-18 TaxID=2724901 RepID=UPI001916886F|nr:hypothetical protein [Nitratiruptor sp. YY09-18]BCD68277.1 hypothetical protein NitYY0918_C1188 [Nitratiruptor sp. YY09-18]